MSSEPIETFVDEPTGKGFWNLLFAQVQGAFSDSVFKFLVLFLATAIVEKELISTQFPEFINVEPKNFSDEVKDTIRASRESLIVGILVVFAIPMLIFAMAAGFLADRFSKSKIVFMVKFGEILIMSGATLAMYLQSVPGMMTILFLMSVQSSFFSPPRLGMMPELLPMHKLSWGNGIMGMGSFFAIIIGAVVAGLLKDFLGIEQAWIGGLFLIGLAMAGTVSLAFLPKLKSANPDARFQPNFVGQIWSNIKMAREDRILFLAISGSVFFWFLAALFGEPTTLAYGEEILNLNDTQISILKAMLGIGIAIGCVLAGTLSAGSIEYGLIPIGAIGLTASAAILGIPGLSVVSVAIMLFCIGLSGGFFVVPINSIVQFRPDAKIKGAVIATERWLTAASVLIAAFAFFLLAKVLGFDPTQIFMIGSVVTLIVTLYTFWLMPEAFARLILWLLTHTFYRIRVVGRENVPEKGGALFVANHLSMADALFVIASTHRQVRFIMHRKMYRRWWIYPVARMLRAIPIASDMSPRDMIQSLNEARKAVEEGHVVCIFAEGQIGHFGQMLPFRKGMNRILKGLEAPIIPVHLDNVWGSIFSFERGKFYFKIPRKIPYPITVSYGASMPPQSSPHEVRKQVIELGTDAWNERKHRIPTIPTALIQSARRNRFRTVFSDHSGKGVSFMTALCRAMIYSQRISQQTQGQSTIGVAMPPSVEAAIINWAILLTGKIPVNLDLEFEPEKIGQTIKTCELQTVIVPDEQENLDNLHLLESMTLLQNLTAPIGTWEYLGAWIKANLLPKSILRRNLASYRDVNLDDVATICRTRGRTGEPKHVKLSHYNVVSNIQQLNQVFNFNRDDSIANVIPVSHALGFTTVVVLPAVLGTPVYTYHRIDDGNAVGQMVEANRVTTLICTTDILENFIKGASPEQFGSLKTVLVGGKKLTESVETQFEDKFGIKPLEGYGCTECSPIVTVNSFDFRTAGKRQVGAKKGSIGMGLPGLSLKVVSPGTENELGFEEEGVLMVKGPNVMLGYLENSNTTEKAVRNGWFDTGDLATIDEDGFVRFSEQN